MQNKEKATKLSRRDFVKSSVAAAAFTIVPRHVLGGDGYTPASEKLNIAGIGVGGRGRGDVGRVHKENIVALCDVDDVHAAKTFEIYKRAKKYRDFRKMLDKEKSIDAVVIATPDHLHAVISMWAIKMGKHVYCEKPLTHDIYEARMLGQAARESNVATQMGNQGHSNEGIRLIKEWIDDGAIGTVREAHCWTDRPMDYWPQGIDRPEETPPVPETLDWDLWLGPAPCRPYHPAYVPFKWRGWWDFGCGALGDMGCHIIDIPFWVLGLGHPICVEASSTKVNSETAPLASNVHYKFPACCGRPEVNLTWYDGGLMPLRPEGLEPGRKMGDRNGGVLLVGDKGMLMCGHAGDSPRLIPEEKMQAYELPPKTIPRSIGHHAEWVEACKGRGVPTSNFGDYAALLTEVVLLGNVAIRTGQKLYWDGVGMKVTNVPEANNYLHTEYRQEWSL